MSDTLVNMRDIRFVLYEMLDVETLTNYEYFRDHSRETFDTAIDAAYKLAREVCWPAYMETDRIGVIYDARARQPAFPNARTEYGGHSRKAAGMARRPLPTSADSSSRVPWRPRRR